MGELLTELFDATALFAGRRTLDTTGRGVYGSTTMCCCQVGGTSCSLQKQKKTCSAWNKATQKHYMVTQRVAVYGTGPLQPSLGRCLLSASVSAADVEVLKLSMRNVPDGEHPKLDMEVPEDAVKAQSKVSGGERNSAATVYLLRHGFSTYNSARESATGAIQALLGRERLTDAPLTITGQDQAVASQEFFGHELLSVEPEEVQLASSLLSRAYDTLILATSKAWYQWDKDGRAYMVDQVPALMEFGGPFDCVRQGNLTDTTPVRAADSTQTPRTTLMPMFSEKFYESDGKSWTTSKPWRVMAGYVRRNAKKCDGKQMDDVLRYLTRQVMAGKTRIVLGTHSNFINCFVRHALSLGIAADTTGGGKPSMHVPWHRIHFGVDDGEEKPSGMDVYNKKVPNGAVLAFRFEVPTDDEPVLSKLRMSHLSIRAPGRGFPVLGILSIKVLNMTGLEATEKFGGAYHLKLHFGGHVKALSGIERANDNHACFFGFNISVPVTSVYQVLRWSVLEHDVDNQHSYWEVNRVDMPVSDFVTTAAYENFVRFNVWKGRSEYFGVHSFMEFAWKPTTGPMATTPAEDLGADLTGATLDDGEEADPTTTTTEADTLEDGQPLEDESEVSDIEETTTT